MSNGEKKNMEKYSFLTAGLKIGNGKISVVCLGYCILSTFLFSPTCPPVYMRVIGDSIPCGCKGQRTFGICIIRCPLVSTLQLSALYGRGQMLAFLTAQLASNPPLFQTFSLQGCVHELRIFWNFLLICNYKRFEVSGINLLQWKAGNLPGLRCLSQFMLKTWYYRSQGTAASYVDRLLEQLAPQHMAQGQQRTVGVGETDWRTEFSHSDQQRREPGSIISL